MKNNWTKTVDQLPPLYELVLVSIDGMGWDLARLWPEYGWKNQDGQLIAEPLYWQPLTLPKPQSTTTYDPYREQFSSYSPLGYSAGWNFISTPPARQPGSGCRTDDR